MDQDDNTGIRIFPLVGWDLAGLPGGGVLMKVDYLPGEPTRPVTPEHARALAESLCVGMTAAECKDLAAALTKAAEEAEKHRSV